MCVTNYPFEIAYFTKIWFSCGSNAIAKCQEVQGFVFTSSVNYSQLWCKNTKWEVSERSSKFSVACWSL